ncbi:MAG: tetratricopeptide repeat protein [Anaerolineales bacterium]|nr:tetratricopeptide repeat protein [Anaerolineales bacterium]
MSGQEDLFQKAMNQGHSAAWDQAWDKAADYYRQALEYIPDHPKALTSLGLALYEMQSYEDALQYYQRAVEVAANDPVPLEKVAEILERLGKLPQATKAYMEVAELYARNKDIEKAIENWTSVVSLNPENMAAHSRLAVVYERLNRKQQALTEYLAVATLLQHAGQVQKAVQTINHAIQIIPDSQEAKQALAMLQTGKLLAKPQRPRGVTGPLRMAQVRQLEAPKDDRAKRPLLDPIQDARQAALTMLAEMLFEQAPEQSEGPQGRQGLSAIMRGTGILGHQYDHSKIMLHLSQAIDLQSHGDNSQAIVELERAMDAGLDSSAASFSLGYLLAQENRLEDVPRHLQRAVKHELFALGARLLLGQTWHKLQHLKEAAICYLDGLRIADSESVSPEYAEEISQLYEPTIEAFSQQGDENLQKRICDNVHGLLVRRDWRENMKQARQQLPAQMDGAPPIPLAEMLTQASSSQVVESLARVNSLARQGKLRTAMEEAFYAIKYAPTYLPLHICIGDLLLQENRTQEAVHKFAVVADSYSARGEAGRAIGLLRRVSELAPMDMESRNRLIDLMIAGGQTIETINEFLKLAEVYYSLADLSTARKTYTRALRYAQQANVDREIKVKVLHRMADIDMQSLDWRQALRVFEQIRTLEPDDEKSRSMLVELNLRLGQSTQALAELDNYIDHLLETHQEKKALDYLTTMVQENPQQPALHRRLADLYRQLGRNAEAIDQLDAAGELYMQTGNRAAAIEAVMAILALNPPNAGEYQQLLTQLHSEE